jgi:hypothetical protein
MALHKQLLKCLGMELFDVFATRSAHTANISKVGVRCEGGSEKVCVITALIAALSASSASTFAPSAAETPRAISKVAINALRIAVTPKRNRPEAENVIAGYVHESAAILRSIHHRVD